MSEATQRLSSPHRTKQNQNSLPGSFLASTAIECPYSFALTSSNAGNKRSFPGLSPSFSDSNWSNMPPSNGAKPNSLRDFCSVVDSNVWNIVDRRPWRGEDWPRPFKNWKKSAKTAKRTDDRGQTRRFCRSPVNRWATRWTLERQTHIYVTTKMEAGTMLLEYLACQAKDKLYQPMCYAM